MPGTVGLAKVRIAPYPQFPLRRTVMAIAVQLSTITAKGQTTVPKAIRDALGLVSGDRIAFRVEGEAILVTRADDVDDDPVLGAFLRLLESDMVQFPSRLTPLDPDLMARIDELTDGVDDDLDGAISGDIRF
jgi:antitoxin PrlF